MWTINVCKFFSSTLHTPNLCTPRNTRLLNTVRITPVHTGILSNILKANAVPNTAPAKQYVGTMALKCKRSRKKRSNMYIFFNLEGYRHISLPAPRWSIRKWSRNVGTLPCRFQPGASLYNHAVIGQYIYTWRTIRMHVKCTHIYIRYLFSLQGLQLVFESEVQRSCQLKPPRGAVYMIKLVMRMVIKTKKYCLRQKNKWFWSGYARWLFVATNALILRKLVKLELFSSIHIQELRFC